MKNFIKLFFTILCFFISLTNTNPVLAQNLVLPELQPAISSITAPEPEISVTPNDCEKFITSANNRTQEIFTSNQKKDINFSGASDKTAIQNKLTQQFFNSKYNKINNLKSHKISSYLSNEICTRAP